MTEQDEISLLLADLSAADPRDRVAVLKVLVDDPTGDARLVPALERLLDDRTASVLMLPTAIGELRWLAAQALARELAAAGQARAVQLPQTVKPLTVHELSTLAERHFGSAAAPWPPLEKFDRLREAGHLPLRDLAF